MNKEAGKHKNKKKNKSTTSFFFFFECGNWAQSLCLDLERSKSVPISLGVPRENQSYTIYGRHYDTFLFFSVSSTTENLTKLETNSDRRNWYSKVA